MHKHKHIGSSSVVNIFHLICTRHNKRERTPMYGRTWIQNEKKNKNPTTKLAIEINVLDLIKLQMCLAAPANH